MCYHGRVGENHPCVCVFSHVLQLVLALHKFRLHARQPRFFSGDNPIVVTMGGLALLGAFATAARANGALAMDGLVLCAGLAFGLSRLTLD